MAISSTCGRIWRIVLASAAAFMGLGVQAGLRRLLQSALAGRRWRLRDQASVASKASGTL